MEPATTTTTSKDMPESMALSDILTVPEAPSSLVVNPHDIQLQPFCTQASSQDQEFASRYPASAPDNLLPGAEALHTDVGRECLEELHRHEQPQPAAAQQPPDHSIPQQHPQHASLPDAVQQQHVPQLQERTPTPPTTSPEPSPHHQHFASADHGAIQQLGLVAAAGDGRRHYSVKKVEHQNSRANRRGPMDEMRQLVRILVKLMPKSLPYLKVDEAGGGNRVTEDDIKSYISAVLGEAPQPVWGLPEGWGAYLSDLFSWACSRQVGRQEAMRCARRLPGRSWEAVDEELARLGMCPGQWPLPLNLKGVKEANANAGALQALPAAVPEPAAPPPGAPLFTTGAVVRSLVEAHKVQAAEEHPAAPKKKKARLSVQEQVLPLVSHATEKECWYLAMLFLQEATAKAGTTPSRLNMELDTYQSGVRKIVDGVSRVSSASLQLNHPVGLQARQLLSNFQPSEGTEPQVFHTHQLTIPGLTDHIYLPSNSAIVPVPVQLGQLGMQNAPSLSRLPNLQPLHRLPLATAASGHGSLGASQPASEAGPSDANPAKPLRPMPRSVQQLGMQAAAYQLMPSTSASEVSLVSKALIDSQKFLGGNGFAPYAGAAKVSAAEQLLQQHAAAEPLAWSQRGAPLGESGEAGASGAGGERQPENPRERLRGMLAQIQTTAVNRQMSQGAAALEALGLVARPSSGGSQGEGGAAGCTEQQPGASGVRASSAMPAAAV